MGTLKTILFAMFVSSTALAGDFHLFRTCSCRLLEGEYSVYLSSDRRLAKVSLSGVEDYVVSEFHLGPVASFDFESPLGIERIIIAIDGGHELYRLDSKTRKFQKVADLNCYK